jgi:heme-degrading monooxygenase HmoA
LIFELVDIEVKPGSEAAFEAAFAAAIHLFQSAAGCHGLSLQRSIERPTRYCAVVGWATMEDHTLVFRQSEAFQAWRERVGRYYAAAPQIQHVTTVLTSGRADVGSTAERDIGRLTRIQAEMTTKGPK